MALEKSCLLLSETLLFVLLKELLSFIFLTLGFLGEVLRIFAGLRLDTRINEDWSAGLVVVNVISRLWVPLHTVSMHQSTPLFGVA